MQLAPGRLKLHWSNCMKLDMVSSIALYIGCRLIMDLSIQLLIISGLTECYSHGLDAADLLMLLYDMLTYILMPDIVLKFQQL